MVKSFSFIAAFFLIIDGLWSQQHIIPRPDILNTVPAQFAFTEQTAIVANRAAMSEAQFFASWLLEATGK